MSSVPSPRRLRQTAVLLTAGALVATMVVTSPAQARQAERRPTNAGKIYRWGDSQWHDGFIGPLRRAWQVNRHRQVRNQHGMLTIESTAAPHTVVAKLGGHARRYGRWETRIRARQYTTGHTPYTLVAELVPAGKRAYHCGARTIQVAAYKLGTDRAHVSIRNLPDVKFTYGKRRDLGPRQFHTYAVEVTRTHISWFVDARVVMTERRPAARSGTKFQVRFRLIAKRGHRMNPARMQMDWLRYYTLERKNARSIKAPHAHRGTFSRAC